MGATELLIVIDSRILFHIEELKMNPQSFEEQMFFLTMRIDVSSPLDGDHRIGTGFFVRHDFGDGQSLVLLVTCRHVLFEGEGMVTFHFNRRKSPESQEVNLGDVIKIGPAGYSDVYFGHKDLKVDLAAINVSSVIDNRELYYRQIGKGNWANLSDTKLLPTNEVLFVGYPIGFSDQVNNLPIARFGKIASHPRVDFNGLPEYLIDAHVYPGSSGSPVFTVLEGRYKFCGVLGKSVSRVSEVRELERNPNIGTDDFIGIGIVYKPAAVLELVEQAAYNFRGNGR